MMDFNDWLAITNVKAAYCRLLDTKDWDGWGRLFTDDFHLDTTSSGGGVTHTREAAVSSTRSAIETAKTVHQVHSPEIAFDGDKATVIWAMQDRIEWNESRSMSGWGHYHERYVRMPDGWRIASSTLTRLIVDFEG